MSVKDTVAEIHWLTGAYVLVIILLVFTHARAFHFNPVMGLLGYHFYSLKNGDGKLGDNRLVDSRHCRRLRVRYEVPPCWGRITVSGEEKRLGLSTVGANADNMAVKYDLFVAITVTDIALCDTIWSQ